MARSSRNRTRRRGRGRFGLLFKVLCLLALVVALTAGATVFFRVEVVSVEGNHRYTREEIVEVAGIQQGDNLYAWNKFQVAERLLQSLPYIGEVSIRRVLPSTVVITVSEWDAVARVLPYDDPEEPAEPEGTGGEAGSGGGAPGRRPGALAHQREGQAAGERRRGQPAMAVTGLTALLPQAGSPWPSPRSSRPGWTACWGCWPPWRRRG